MIHIICIEPDGTARRIAVDDGESVMRAALDAGVEGMVGECGGGLACATCHCFVADDWSARRGKPPAPERGMLDCPAGPARPNSRLACQIVVTPHLDGLVIGLPAT